MAQALLEVLVRHPGDVAGADEGGADRLHLVGEADLSPEPALVSAVCRESELPVHVRLRLNDTWTTTGGELARLVGLAEDFLRCGAAGLSFGFLDPDLRVDVEVTTHVAEAMVGVPWVFHRGFDDALEPERAWATVLEIPGLVGVQSAGSPRGLAVGYDDLLALATRWPRIAERLVAAGGLAGEHVPWLVRVGVRSFQVGAQVRPGGTDKAYVDAGHVRSWRLLLDDAVALAERSASAG
ncbi:copper homeostasis protein CutC [Nocardioides aestuarii]|uniref:Copper homeostasis protein cutC homolog n=1 Tax=Nocardioides aestuarii TaxID=252231 RepID=A0ABW4TMI1_9ACTN